MTGLKGQAYVAVKIRKSTLYHKTSFDNGTRKFLLVFYCESCHIYFTLDYLQRDVQLKGFLLVFVQ